MFSVSAILPSLRDKKTITVLALQSLLLLVIFGVISAVAFVFFKKTISLS